MPEEAQQVFEFALLQAQIGQRQSAAKALKGLGWAEALKIACVLQGSACRAGASLWMNNGAKIHGWRGSSDQL